jgi:hypothetical protein
MARKRGGLRTSVYQGAGHWSILFSSDRKHLGSEKVFVPLAYPPDAYLEKAEVSIARTQ